MNHRLNQQTAQQLDTTAQVQSQRRTFDEAEQVIRADREQTAVPEKLGDKLADTLASEPRPVAKESWWKRLFG